MAAPYNPPVKAEDFIFRIALYDAANPQRLKATPTLAAADFKIDKDGGGLNPLNTTPTNDPAGSVWVKITLSSTEMNADIVSVQCIDATATPEWCDMAICIPTCAA